MHFCVISFQTVCILLGTQIYHVGKIFKKYLFSPLATKRTESERSLTLLMTRTSPKETIWEILQHHRYEPMTDHLCHRLKAKQVEAVISATELRPHTKDLATGKRARGDVVQQHRPFTWERRTLTSDLRIILQRFGWKYWVLCEWQSFLFVCEARKKIQVVATQTSILRTSLREEH